MTILALLVSCFQVGVVGAALWCGVCVCVRAHVCVCVGFDLCGSDASTVKYFFYTPSSIQPWRFQCEHIVFFSMRVCVCVSNAWVSGGVCRCTPSVMQWQQFLRLIFSSPIFLELSVLWRCPQPPPLTTPTTTAPTPLQKSVSLTAALFVYSALRQRGAASPLRQTGIGPVWNQVLTLLICRLLWLNIFYAPDEFFFSML